MGAPNYPPSPTLSLPVRKSNEVITLTRRKCSVSLPSINFGKRIGLHRAIHGSLEYSVSLDALAKIGRSRLRRMSIVWVGYTLTK